MMSFIAFLISVFFFFSDPTFIDKSDVSLKWHSVLPSVGNSPKTLITKNRERKS